MTRLNLGAIEANTLLIFGGPYGNLEATQALLAKAQELAIPAEHIICTGDLAAYCADPAATVSVIRDEGIHTIQGNCEQSLAAGADDCGCGFDSGTTCEALSRSWFTYCQRQIDRDTQTWFGGLPTQIAFEFGGKRFLVVHGSVANMSDFVFASTAKDALVQNMRAAEVDCVIGGHSGLPFTQVMDDLCWHNAGVIGMPANDATARVWYSVITQTALEITFEHRSLQYTADITAAKMQLAGLPTAYAESLTSGLWPSLDVLPEFEATQAGVRLSEHHVAWAK